MTVRTRFGKLGKMGRSGKRTRRPLMDLLEPRLMLSGVPTGPDHVFYALVSTTSAKVLWVDDPQQTANYRVILTPDDPSASEITQTGGYSLRPFNTTFIDLTPGAGYTATVVAENASGVSPVTADTQVHFVLPTSNDVVAPPTGVTVICSPGAGQGSMSLGLGAHADIYWNDNSTAEVAYQIEEKGSAYGNFYTAPEIGDGYQLTPKSFDANSGYAQVEVMPDVPWAVRVRAKGNGVGAYSNTVSFTAAAPVSSMIEDFYLGANENNEQTLWWNVVPGDDIWPTIQGTINMPGFPFPDLWVDLTNLMTYPENFAPGVKLSEVLGSIPSVSNLRLVAPDGYTYLDASIPAEGLLNDANLAPAAEQFGAQQVDANTLTASWDPLIYFGMSFLGYGLPSWRALGSPLVPGGGAFAMGVAPSHQLVSGNGDMSVFSTLTYNGVSPYGYVVNYMIFTQPDYHLNFYSAVSDVAISNNPGTLTGAVSGTTVNLAWDNPVQGTANSVVENFAAGIEDGFYIQVSTDGQTWQNMVVEDDITSYQLTGLAANTTYYFRVSAWREGQLDSALTNTITLTTTGS